MAPSPAGADALRNVILDDNKHAALNEANHD
jgi:hypothetical protein